MIDRHYGHLVRDGREHAITPSCTVDAGGRCVDAENRDGVNPDNESRR
jgi:hypothetical protein